MQKGQSPTLTLTLRTNPNPNPGPDPNPNQGLKTKLSDKSAELAAAEGELAKLRQQLDEVQRREERTKEMLRATQVSPTPWPEA